MDLKDEWGNLANRYNDEHSRILDCMSSVSPASDEYTRMVDNLKTLKSVESQAIEDLVDVAREAAAEAESEREASKPEIGKKDLLQILVPAGCVALTLALEFGANGVVTSKVFQKLPFFR